MALPGLCGVFSLKGKRGHAQAVELEEPTKCATKRKRQSVRRRVDDEVWNPRKGRAFPQPSVSRGQSARPYLLLLSMPRHTSSLSLSHALSSTLRRKTLSRLLSPSPISTQKRLLCPCYTRYPDSQPIPITSRPIQFSPHKPGSAFLILIVILILILILILIYWWRMDYDYDYD
jgi:hypothetical protein